MALKENRYTKNRQEHSYGIYICTNCHMSTFICEDYQITGNRFGDSARSVPHEVNSLYEEACNSFATETYIGVVLLCRKLLMRIATDLGADTNLSVIEYVNFLKSIMMWVLEVISGLIKLGSLVIKLIMK